MAYALSHRYSRHLIIAAALFIQGCSGGGSAPTAVAPKAAAPSPSASAYPTSAKASVSFKVFIPAKKTPTAGRRRAFVSSSTNGLSITVYTSPEASNPTPLATAAIDLSASSPACTASAAGRTCSATFPAPPGTDDVTFTSYDEAPVSGTFPSGAQELATATLAGLAVVEGKLNTFYVALGGVVSSIAITPAFRSLDAAVSGSYPLGVTAFDADGNMIVAGSETVTNGSTTETDTYANPITLAVTAGGSDTSLSLNGATAASSITVTKSSDVVTVSYDGAAASGYSATIGASASGATGATATFSPLFATPRTIAFSAGSQSQNITLSEMGFTGTFLASVANAGSSACPSGAVTLGTIASGTPATLAVMSGSTAASGCTIAISDATTTVNVTASVTLSGTTITVPSKVILAAVGSTVETINLANTSQTSTLNISVPGSASGDTVAVTGVARDDSSGAMYVAAKTSTQNTIEEYAAGATGAAATLAAVSVPTSCAVGNLALDRQNNVYVACLGANTILEYAAGLSSATPLATIALANAGIPYGLTLDAAGNVYVSESLENSGGGVYGVEIEVYAPPGPGTNSAPPFRIIAGSATDLGGKGSNPGLSIDASGNLFVVGENGNEPSYEFGPQAVGNVAPSATFPVTGYSYSLVVNASGTSLYDSFTDRARDMYAINVYTVANPSAAPQTFPIAGGTSQLAL